MSLPDLAAACRTSGLPVVEVPGWQTRGRPAYTGGFSPRGIVVHHTGDNGSVAPLRYASTTLANGFSSLPGPLCQVGLGRDGTVYVVAAGRANHAGSVRSVGFMAAGDGNAQALGIEAMNSGGEGWSAVQLDAYHRLCAALCDHYGWPRSHVVAHAECSTAGKWDPGYQGRVIDMGAFRRGVANAQVGDDMAFSPADFWNVQHKVLGGKTAYEWLGELPWRVWTVSHAALGGRTAYEVLATTEAKVDAVIEAVGQVDGVDPDAIRDAVREAVESISVTVRPASSEQVTEP